VVNVNDEAQAERELAHAVATGQADTIARVAMANLWPLYTNHSEALTSAVSLLPSTVLKRYPALRVVHPLTVVLAQTTRPFKPLVSPDEARSMHPDELDLVTLAQMVAFRFSGDVSAALIYAQRLEDRVAQIKHESRERIDGPLWYYHFSIGSTRLAAGDSSRALLEFATSRQLGAFSKQPYGEKLALGRIALAHAVRGSLTNAELALAEAAELVVPSAAHRAGSLSTEQTAAALVAVERMAPDAERLLGTLEPYNSTQLTWPFVLLAHTRWLLAQHRPTEALELALLTRDAHPPQHGSVASDIINAASIDALWGVDDVATARRLADSHTKPGPLTLFAIARLALNESRIDTAAQSLRRLEAAGNLGPVHGITLQLFTVWLELLRSGSIDSATAQRLARIAITTDSRRLYAGMPRQLVETVAAQLQVDEADEFVAALGGLTFLDVEPRPKLTKSETRVLHAILVHPTTATIATSLHLSPNTIKSHLKSLYRKLGCATRAEAITIAARFHLIPRESD